MRNILRFLARYNTFLLFLLLQTISLHLLFNRNNFQQSTVFSTTNRLNAWFYTVEESVTGYLHLRQNNEALMRQNNNLEIRIAQLQSALQRYEDTTSIPLLRMKEAEEFSLIPARVIRNSVSKVRNYITLNVGSKDGVEPQMGVANADGIIGVVSHVSEHYAVVIPVLNPQIRFSCKLKNSNASGSLVWNGTDRRFANLEEIPPYVAVSKGDTIVTSGYSAIFPEGLMVGTVEDYAIGEDANFLRLKIRLTPHFDAISNVRVIRYKLKGELKQLDKEAEI